MQIFLIRHAESENNAKPPYNRIEDPGLTAVGRLQADRLADWVKSLAVDVLITSPFRRALQTTQAILNASPQTVHVWHDVFERGGVFRGHGPDAREGGPGMGRSEVLKLIGREDTLIDESIADDGWWQSRPRETDEQCKQRAIAVVGRLRSEFGDSRQNIAIVTHADFKRRLLTEIFADVLNIDRFGLLRNTGVTKLVCDPRHGLWTIDFLNSVTHLPAKLITDREF